MTSDEMLQQQELSSVSARRQLAFLFAIIKTPTCLPAPTLLLYGLQQAAGTDSVSAAAAIPQCGVSRLTKLSPCLFRQSVQVVCLNGVAVANIDKLATDAKIRQGAW